MIGGFAVVWWTRSREFSPSDLALIEAIASQAGVAIENARLFDENRRRVEELSVLHELSRAVTGQLDRAALLDALRGQVARVLDVAQHGGPAARRGRGRDGGRAAHRRRRDRRERAAPATRRPASAS